jgi:hypothetical protein
MHKISKIVIFVISPFDKRDFKRFGIDILRSNGFEVFVYDFSPIVYPRLYKVGVLEPSEYEKHFCFFNKCDAIMAIRKIKTDSFVIFQINYQKDSFWIFKTFSKNNVPYLTIFSGSIPSYYRLEDTYTNGILEDTKHFLNSFFRKISRLSIKKIKNIIYRNYFASYLGVRATDLILVAGAETLNIYRKIIIIGEKTEVLHAPSNDYNIFIENGCPKFNKEAKAVYLDPGITNIRGDDLTLEEDDVLNIPEHPGGVNKEKQCSNLRTFFNKVEEETECIVNIAAHPGYDGCSYPEEFGKRLTIVNKTMEMVGRSTFIMAHSSTAVCFAVIFRKPIIFLTLNPEEELVREKDHGIEQMASWFGKIPIDIDHLIDVDWDKELKINEDLYLNYKNSFLLAKGTEEINSWQIVANRLKLM